MTCYHPLIRIENNMIHETAKDGHKYNKAKVISAHKYLELYDKTDDFDINRYQGNYKTTLIPCGNCIGCRLEYSRGWANRGYLEAKNWKSNLFVTLTYDEGHLPQKEEIITKDGFTYTANGDWQKGTLQPDDLTHFIKTVRKNKEKEYKKDLQLWKEKAATKDPRTPKKPKKPRIRFMACGEYGSEGERPHYHIIFFNLKLKEEDLYSPTIINKEYHFKSHFLEKCWTKKGECEPRGFVDVTDATWNDIAYVARYVTKKINGPGSEYEYAERGQEKEFFRTSRVPGIGGIYFQKNWRKIYKNDEIIINNKKGSHKVQPPKYFDKLYEQMDPDKFEEIKKNRKTKAKFRQQVKDETTSLLRSEQLLIEEHA